MPQFKKRATMGGLMMTRKEGQRVVVNHGEITIEIVEIKGKYVRLAFKANKEIEIQREEVTKTMEELNGG